MHAMDYLNKHGKFFYFLFNNGGFVIIRVFKVFGCLLKKTEGWKHEIFNPALPTVRNPSSFAENLPVRV